MLKPSFIGRKQNKIIVDGVKYRAVTQHGCDGCAFRNSQCVDAPCGNDRKDGRRISWVKHTPKSEAATA